jgi:hypothetical protein
MTGRQDTFVTELNQYFDTIRDRIDAELEVRLRVHDVVSGQNKGEVVAVRIQAEPQSRAEGSEQSKLSEPASSSGAREDESTTRGKTPRVDFCSAVRLANLCKLLRKLKVLAPRQKCACKRALQYYYGSIKGRRVECRQEVKVKFVAMTLVILKAAMDADAALAIRRLERWRARVRQFEEEHPLEFRAALRLFAKRQ